MSLQKRTETEFCFYDRSVLVLFLFEKKSIRIDILSEKMMQRGVVRKIIPNIFSKTYVYICERVCYNLKEHMFLERTIGHGDDMGQSFE